MQGCFQRSNEYQLIDCAKYFLDKVDEVRKPEYNPSEQVENVLEFLTLKYFYLGHSSLSCYDFWNI